jgi:hypothetical protein
MKLILKPFLLLSGFGLALSVLVHVSTIINVGHHVHGAFMFLHFGVFIVWVPAVIAANVLVKEYKRKDFWKAALRACPAWMKYMTFLFFIYAIINFISSFVFAVNSDSSNNFKTFSGHWMAFYSIAFAVLYSALHADEYDSLRKCPNGHKTTSFAKYCDECGAKITEYTSKK